MNISNWGIGRIMQLPDWCFGRRWCVSTSVRIAAGATIFDISEGGLGDRAVLWNLAIRHSDYTNEGDYIRLALGDQLPAVPAEVDGLEPLIHGLGSQGAEPRQIWVGQPGLSVDIPLRQVINAQGRRLVLQLTSTGMQEITLLVALTVSSIPKEVPDWLVSV